MIINSNNDETLRAAMALLDAVNAHDKEAFAETIHDEIVYAFRHEGHPTVTGRENVLAAWDGMLAGLPDIHEHVTEALVRDDLAIIYWDMSGSLSGPMPLGKRLAIPDRPQDKVTTSGVDIFLVKDGKVIRKDTLLDVGVWFDAFSHLAIDAEGVSP